MDTPGRILVIDDELGIRQGCKRVLEPEGFEVETADTVQKGLDRIRAGAFDLVLLDVMMPDGRGIDLLGPIAEQDANIVTIIITGYATVELAVEAIKRGAYDFISKPFSPDQLLLTVNQGLERRRLALEAERLQSVERQAQQLADEKAEMERLDRFKTSFMLTVAHELRSPVASAQSLIRALLKGLAGTLNEQQSDILSRIEVRLNALLELINDLLSLAKTRNYDIEKPLKRVSLSRVLDQIVDHYAIEAQNKRLQLTADVPVEDVWVQATEEGLQKVFGNLITNAIKYSTEGGSIHLGVAREPDMVRVSVRDTGIGIPEEAVSRLGEEFFRASNAKQSGIGGTGLGLSIVKEEVGRFGGKMTVQSAIGEGSSFTIHLPLSPQPAKETS